jgi:hypothetical protein
MRPDAIPVKTDHAREVLRSGRFSGTRAQRALLIMVDGQKSVDRLIPAMASLGLSASDLQQLAEAGLLAWRLRQSSRTVAKMAPGTSPADGPVVDSAVLSQSTMPADWDDAAVARSLPFSRLDIEL